MRKLFSILSFLLILIISIKAAQNADPVIAQSENNQYFPVFTQHTSFRRFSSIGPDGGTVTAIEIDPSDPQVLYAGTWGHGIYQSLDGGGHWVHMSEGLKAGFVFDLAIDPKDNQHILASAYRYGAYESFTGGETWQKTYGLPEDTVVYAFAFHPRNPKIVYAAVRLKTIYNPSPHYPGGVYKSIDGGSHWFITSLGLPDDYVYDVAIDPRQPNVLYTAMHQTGVYKSVDDGASWFSVNNNIHYRDARSLAINPNDSTIYVGMYDGYGVAYSTNGGASWSTINATVAQRIYIYKLQLDPYNQKSLYLNTPDGLFRCEDLFFPQSKTPCIRIAHDDRYVFSLALDASSASATGEIKNIYTGLQTFGLFKSTNAGAGFSPSYKGLKANVILSVANDPEVPDTLYTSVLGRGVFKSLNAGSSWIAVRDGLPSKNINELIFRPGDSQVLYAATADEGLYFTTDGGATWLPRNGGLLLTASERDESAGLDQSIGFNHLSFAWMDPVDIEALQVEFIEQEVSTTSTGYPEILTIQINPQKPAQMLIGTAGHGVLMSDDYGQTWQTTELPFGDVYDSIVDLSRSVFVYHIGVMDASVRGSDLLRVSWPGRNAGFHPGADVFGLSVGYPGVYFAATDQGIYQSTSGGGVWALVGLSDQKFTTIYANPYQPREVWAASLEGLYHSIDAGRHWELVGNNNLNDQFLTISQGYGDYAVYFGTSGGNIFRIEH